MILKPLSPCGTCVGAKWEQGFVPPSGSGESGVLVVAEAAGADELREGMGFVGKAGYFLFQNLKRVGVEREGLRLANVLSCRPPMNKLAGMEYEEEAIAHCSPLLDAEIDAMRDKCARNGKRLTIITLGRIAFKRVMGLKEKDPILRHDYMAYPFWNTKYQAWVFAAHHPSFLMRGNTHLLAVLQFVFKRALEVAEEGITLASSKNYLLDPNPTTFAQWCKDYLRYAAAHPCKLSFDIETPMKQGRDEEKVSKEEDDDYTILRCSFAYLPGESVSVKWTPEYRPMIEELFAAPYDVAGWNSENYDVPRITAQMPINGDRYDGMQMWHVLNSALPKGLGFVTPFYCQTQPVWKYLSEAEPALYNAVDADTALQNILGIERDLRAQDLWKVYSRHVVELNRVLSYMSGKGVLLDQEGRKTGEEKLSGLLNEVETRMEASVPKEVRKLKVYKKTPKDTTGMIEVEGTMTVSECPGCGLIFVKADHYKSIGKKKWAQGHFENPCVGFKSIKRVVPTKLWAMPQKFRVSKVGLSSYQATLKHQAILSRREGKVTFDEPALMKLIKKYPKDPLYPIILDHRKITKLLGTYIGVTDPTTGRIRGGMPVHGDGRIHTTYTHNPSTLRLASQSPNLQNLPRVDPTDAEALENLIRNLVVAAPGCQFVARDYSGIEAVLCGFYASSPRYIRLAKMDVHSFYTAYALHELDGRVKTSDLPDFSWDDERLRAHLAWIKKEFKQDRNNLYKHLVHGNNFMQGAKGTQAKVFAETGVEYPLDQIKKVMEVYFALFPEIRTWHRSLLLQAEEFGFLRNAFGYVHRFNKVFEYEKWGGKWEKKPGPDSNKCIAFLPQSTAAGIIKEAMLRLYFNRFEEAGVYLRLQVHDEILAEVPVEEIARVDGVMQEEMERPIPELALPASYGMGSYLVIDTEAKKPHHKWGSM